MKPTLVTLLFVSLIGSTWLIAQNGPRPDQPGSNPTSNEKKPDLMGRVVGVSDDGQTITLAMPPKPAGQGQPVPRDAKPEEARVRLLAKTRIHFFGVEDGEARPLAGQMAMVWLEQGSTDVAARVRFMKREGEQRPDVQGRIVAVSPDRRTITVETREIDRTTGQEKASGKVDVRLAPYTQALYFGVEPGGAQPTLNYLVVGWFEKGSKDTAVRIRFMRNEDSKAAR